MYNHLVREPASKIREIARDALRGYWKPMFVATLIYFVLTNVVSEVLSLIFSVDMTEIYNNAGITIKEGVSTSLDCGGGLYTFIVGGPFLLGFSILLLTFFRTRKVNNSLNFEGFSFFTKAFLLQFFIGLKVFLWSLLFVFPGVIAYYRYSQAFFILADNPDFSVRQCIEESKRLMYGNKAKKFGLDISFIGWAIVAGLPGGILKAIMPESVVGTIIVSIVTYLGMIILYEYVFTAEAAFYELVTERLVVMIPGQQAQDFQQDPNAQGWQQNYSAGEQSADVDAEPSVVDVEYTECAADDDVQPSTDASTEPNTDAGMGEQGTEPGSAPTDEN